MLLEEIVSCIRVMSTAAAKGLPKGRGTDGGELSCSSGSERDYIQEKTDQGPEPCLYLAHIMTCLLVVVCIFKRGSVALGTIIQTWMGRWCQEVMIDFSRKISASTRIVKASRLEKQDG